MRIILQSEEEIVVEPTEAPLTIEPVSPEISYSAFHMLASGLGVCMVSVLHAWATQAELPTDRISLAVKWTFADNPHRVGRYDVKVRWPDLPPERLAAVLRVADLCAVHETFNHPPEIHTEIEK